jgi:uncharacterized protein YbaR (Trm112 family)/SAM-dependent methyltransferase
MSTWSEFYSYLICINCGNTLSYNNNSVNYNEHVEGELVCVSCSKRYPVYQGIPVMFCDNERAKLLLDETYYSARVSESKRKMKDYSQFMGSELKQFRNHEDLLDSIGWEIAFWERWKDMDTSLLEFDRDVFRKYLLGDDEGGGRLEFFNKVLKYSNYDLSNRHLLNVGAGRDVLLEMFLERDCQVIELDIVLESLCLLKRRGATFCVCCDGRSIPFRSDFFDITTSFGSLHHMWPIEKAVGEILRITKGNVHLNEPNYYALTRIGLLLPSPMAKKLKNYYSGDYSHSPYEEVINPFVLKGIVKYLGGVIKEFSFPISSWIPGNSRGIKLFLRRMNIGLTRALPFTSSHFDCVISKQDG